MFEINEEIVKKHCYNTFIYFHISVNFNIIL